MTSVVVVASALPACNNDPTSNDTPYVVVPLTTGALAGTPGRALAETLGVEVRTADGHPVPGATVDWSLPQGGSVAVVGAQLNGATSGTTDDKGRTYAVWTLGLPEGVQQAKAAVGLGEPATFVAQATILHALSVSVGSQYACAVLTDQRPVCWGVNQFGQLGTGDTTDHAMPTTVLGLPAVQEIRASRDMHTCARDLAGDVWCWGKNTSGEVGPAGGHPFQNAPVRVAGAAGAVSLSLSTTSAGYTCAVLAAGGARCWGYNGEGQLGTGDFTSSAAPRPVTGSGSFVSVSSAENRSCALDTSGEVWCWGDARGHELAPLPASIYASPVRPVPGNVYQSVVVGGYAVCGLQLGGVASCFGDDFASFGRLPLSNLQPGDAPVHPDLDQSLAELTSDGWNAIYARTRYGLGYVWGESGCCDVFVVPPLMITPGLRVEAISAGDSQYCVISETGGLYCGDLNWWALGGKEDLAGIPDDSGS